MHVRRIIIEEDYPVIAEWWTKRGQTAPKLFLLPSIGVIAFDHAGPIACAFLYEDKGGVIAFVEWEATNPSCGSVMSKIRGLHMVFDFFETYCRDQGITGILSWVAEARGDGRLLERRNWVKCPGERHALMSFSTHPQEAICQPSL